MDDRDKALSERGIAMLNLAAKVTALVGGTVVLVLFLVDVIPGLIEAFVCLAVVYVVSTIGVTTLAFLAEAVTKRTLFDRENDESSTS